MKRNHLFVYGTLMRGYQNPAALQLAENSKTCQKAYCYGSLYLVEDYPGLVLEGSGKVYGEVFEITAETLAKCDAYEEYNPESPASSEYFRAPLRVYTESGKTFECWAYIYAQGIEGKTLIPSGNFHLEDRRDPSDLRPRERKE